MTGWVVDKSALWRFDLAADNERWVAAVGRGLVQVSSVTLLEVGFSARSGDEARTWTAGRPLALMPTLYLTPPAEDRAVEVQALLADRGQHRAPSVADLLLAAAAELAHLTVLHVDKDFELIAAVTGQLVERLQLASYPHDTTDQENP